MSERAKIPAQGRDYEELLQTMQQYRANDADWRDGRTWSLVYYAGEAHHEFLKKAHNLFFAENALNPMAFKSLKRMEAEVVQMSASLLHGGPECVGTLTTGGTESILMAVKAARDRALARRPRMGTPELVVPATIHVAFDKAAHYFGLRIRYAEVRSDYRVDPAEIRKLVNKNTVLIAASAPQYPQGVIDPIPELAAIARERDLPFHVDACVGGFILPWLEKLGEPIPPFDFRVPGVTSMSADLHKYGFASKGASIVLYRDMSYLKHQFFISTDWTGGIYASPSMTGTRAGGPIAAAWATLNGLGEAGYLDHAKRAMEATKKLIKGINSTPGLRVLGQPDATVLAWQSVDPAVDTYAVADQMQERGWNMDRQQRPPSIHCTVTSNHLHIIDDYVRDLGECVAFVLANPGLASKGNAAMYGMMAKVPIRAMVRQGVTKVMEKMYGPDAGEPEASLGDGPLERVLERYGETINAVLDRAEQVRNAVFGRQGR